RPDAPARRRQAVHSERPGEDPTALERKRPMPDDWFLLLAVVLATWRLAHLVAHEDGPFDVIVSMRRIAGSGMLGRLMNCPYCLSLWFAAPFAWWMADAWRAGITLWLAISGGACLLERRFTPQDH